MEERGAGLRARHCRATTSAIRPTRSSGGTTRGTSRPIAGGDSDIRSRSSASASTCSRRTLPASPFAICSSRTSPSPTLRPGGTCRPNGSTAPASGWAGASLTDFHVWNEDWEVRLDYGRHRLQARDPRFAIDLILYEDRPPVLHGDRGYSQKGTSAGQCVGILLADADAHGRVDCGRRRAVRRARFELDGSRVRHAASSRRASRGWDWLSLQLEDGTDVMLYQLRRQRRIRRPALERHDRARRTAQSPAQVRRVRARAGPPVDVARHERQLSRWNGE